MTEMTGRRHGFTVERDTPVPAERIYDKLADAAAWTQWTSMVHRSELVKMGTPDPLGAGAIRRMGQLGGRFWVDEEILEATRPSLQRYTVRGLPVTNYDGLVRIDEADGRTHIVWTAQFRPIIPGTGAVLGKLLGMAISRI